MHKYIFAFLIILSTIKGSSLNDFENFDFLAKKYPDLIEKSNLPFKLEQEENYSDLELASKDGLIADAKKALSTKNDNKNVIEKEIGMSFHDYTNFHKTQLQFLSLNHELHSFYKVFFDRKNKSYSCLEDIVLASEYIFQLVQDQGGGVVLFLGRSPCFIQTAYDELLKIKPDATQRGINISYSGHANTETSRKSEFYKNHPDLIIARNITNIEKLNHYYKYMDSKNILDTSNIYIVDILGSGIGLNSFISLLKNYYTTRQTNAPAIHLLQLSEVVSYEKFQTANSFSCPQIFKFETAKNKLYSGHICFYEDIEKNIKPHNIPVNIIHLNYITINMILDNDFFQSYFTNNIEYPAQKWTLDYDEELKKGGKFYFQLYDYLKINSNNIIKFHLKKLELRKS